MQVPSRSLPRLSSGRIQPPSRSGSAIGVLSRRKHSVRVAAPERDASEHLADDPLRHERGDVGRANRRRDDLDDVHADEVEPRRELAAVAQRRSPDVMPPGSGVPVPGANAGSSTSTSTVRKTGPRRRGDGALDDLADAELADVVHEERRDPALALPRELGLARPVAAEPDLDVARSRRRARRGRAGTSASVRALDAEDLGSGVRVRVEVDEARPARVGAATARTFASVIEWSPPRTTGTTPAATTWPTVFSICGMRPHRVGRNHGGVAEVDDAELGERVDARLEVRPGRAARGADRARPEARPRPVGDEVVGRARRRSRRRRRRARPGPACRACPRT